MNSTHQTLTPTDSEVVLERIGNKGIITLNRPKALNALNLSMINVIYPQLRKWEMDDTMKMVLIKGTGDRAFCSGGDVKTIAQKGRNDPYGVDFFRNEYRLNNQIGSLSIPYVALLNGITMGGGVGLSVHGAFRVATEKAIFAMPETAIGFFPDVGGSHFLPRLPGKLGLFLALTGHRLEGRDLYKAGVATHFMSSARLPDLEKDLLRLENPNLQSIHQMLSKYQEQWEAEHYKEFSLKPYIGRINSAFGASSVEGIVDNLKKDSSEWAKQQLERLQTFSPTSLKVTFEQMKLGSQLSLADCLRMEYKMSLNFLQNNDFFEGVRAGKLITFDNFLPQPTANFFHFNFSSATSSSHRQGQKSKVETRNFARSFARNSRVVL